MSVDGSKTVLRHPCPICSNTRSVSEHLIEAGLAASYLGNTSTYKSDHGTTNIRTETIGDWFKLAAQLEKVEVNTWKFESSEAGLYCGTVADNIDAHSEHYTNYATELTRFVFVCNGLEEAYRFVDQFYPPLAAAKGLAKKNYKKTSSMRAVMLLDDLFERVGAQAAPKEFEHHCGNLISLFNRYKAEHNASLGGVEPGAEKLPTYALHIVRNLRNHVAHGTFPLGPPTNYGGYEDSDELILMLKHACRIAALYTQIIFCWFSSGFESDDYISMLGWGKEFDRFKERCTLEYVLNLHQQSDFAFHQDHYCYDDDEDDQDIEVITHRQGPTQT